MQQRARRIRSARPTWWNAAPWLVLFTFLLPSLAAGQGRWEDVSSGWEILAAADTVGRSGEWRTVDADRTWADLELMGYEGPLWLRRDMPSRPTDERSAILVGPTRFGWYRLFADGELLGQVGSPSDKMPYPTSRLFPLGSGADRPAVVLEFHRYGWASDAVGQDVGPVEGGLHLGERAALADQLELARRRRMMGDLVPLLLGTLFFVGGLYHLALFMWRRSNRAYLWFGLASLSLAGNTIIYSSWVAESTGSLTVPWRLNEALGHLATAFLIQFLWSVLDRPIGKLLLWYQWSHVALAVGLVVLPFPWVFDTVGYRRPWTWPILGAAAWTLVQETRRGHPEARVLVAGGSLFIGAIAMDMMRGFVTAIPSGLPPFGFAALVVSMAMSLGQRFSRVHHDLDKLRADLESNVRRRTKQLVEALEELSRANDAKTAFLANMSHELRTPLNSVIGFSELLLTDERSNLPETEVRKVQHIHDSGEHLLQLVDQVLDIAAVESGRIDLAPEPVDVGRLVRSLLSEMEPTLTAKSLRLELTIPDEPEVIETDPLRLKQVLSNLVGNAIKFTDEGSVSVLVYRNPSDRLVIRVADTGAGIPAEKLRSVFEPFERLGAGGHEREGTGLGLAISSALCAKLGAELSVESTVGVGSSFEVTLPRLGGENP